MDLLGDNQAEKLHLRLDAKGKFEVVVQAK